MRHGLRAGGRAADNLLLLRFKAGSLVGADVVPPDVELDAEAVQPETSLGALVRTACSELPAPEKDELDLKGAGCPAQQGCTRAGRSLGCLPLQGYRADGC